jgi:hypothetical protein
MKTAKDLDCLQQDLVSTRQADQDLVWKILYYVPD